MPFRSSVNDPLQGIDCHTWIEMDHPVLWAVSVLLRKDGEFSLRRTGLLSL